MDLSSLNILLVPTMQIVLCVVIASLFKIAMHVPGRKKTEAQLEKSGEQEVETAPSTGTDAPEGKEEEITVQDQNEAGVPVEEGVSAESAEDIATIEAAAELQKLSQLNAQINAAGPTESPKSKKGKEKRPRAASLDAKLGQGDRDINEALKSFEAQGGAYEPEKTGVFCGCFGR